MADGDFTAQSILPVLLLALPWLLAEEDQRSAKTGVVTASDTVAYRCNVGRRVPALALVLFW